MNLTDTEKKCIASIMAKNDFDVKDKLIMKLFRLVQDEENRSERYRTDLNLLRSFYDEDLLVEALQASKATVEHCKYFYNGPHSSELDACLDMINNAIGGLNNVTSK